MVSSVNAGGCYPGDEEVAGQCRHCEGSGSDSGGGCEPGCITSELGCPDGQTGSRTLITCQAVVYFGGGCQTTQRDGENTCSPVCTNNTVDVGCQYGGHDYVTTDCHGAFVSEDKQCNPPPPSKCSDPAASNYGGSLPCTYPPTTCTDPAAINSGGSLPCRYPTQTCTDPAASNYGATEACQYSNGCPDPESVDQGCPAGYTGSNTVTTWYSNPPACTPHTTRDNQCVPQDATTLTVTSNLASAWTIAPGLSGTGSTTLHPTPSAGGTIYTLTPASVSGYAYPPLVTNSVTGAGSSFLMFPGQTAGFTITYSSLSASFDYSLSNSGTVTVMKGGRPTYGQETITKTLVSGTSQSTDLSLSGVPANVSYQFANAMCSPTCTSTITFTVDAAAAVGTYPITVTGTGGKTTSFNLVIDNSPNMSVTCIASPTPALVGQNVTWTGNVTGGVPPYTFVWSGTNITDPAPTTQSFSKTYSTVGAKTAQLHVTDSLSNVATCTPAGTAQINFNPQFKEI